MGGEWYQSRKCSIKKSQMACPGAKLRPPVDPHSPGKCDVQTPGSADGFVLNALVRCLLEDTGLSALGVTCRPTHTPGAQECDDAR